MPYRDLFPTRNFALQFIYATSFYCLGFNHIVVGFRLQAADANPDRTASHTKPGAVDADFGL